MFKAIFLLTVSILFNGCNLINQPKIKCPVCECRCETHSETRTNILVEKGSSDKKEVSVKASTEREVSTSENSSISKAKEGISIRIPREKSTENQTFKIPIKKELSKPKVVNKSDRNSLKYDEEKVISKKPTVKVLNRLSNPLAIESATKDVYNEWGEHTRNYSKLNSRIADIKKFANNELKTKFRPFYSDYISGKAKKLLEKLLQTHRSSIKALKVKAYQYLTFKGGKYFILEYERNSRTEEWYLKDIYPKIEHL